MTAIQGQMESHNLLQQSRIRWKLIGGFSSIPWPIGLSGGTRGTIQQGASSCLFCRRPLWAFLVLAWLSTLWCCPSSISSADHGIIHPPRCPEEWFWRGCRGMWHFRTTQVSVSWQLLKEVPEDPQGSWSCSAPSPWSWAPSRRYGDVSL